MIDTAWGSLDKFKADFNAQTAAIQGSGWGWLVYDKSTKGLGYRATPNQDLVTKQPGIVPLLTIDIWEHAYYLDYKNVRPDFLKEIWRIVHWEHVEHRLRQAKE